MSFDLPGVKPGSDIETLFKAVGFVVVQWGHAEQSLDLMVATIFHRFDGHPLLKRRPRLLGPKLDFLRKCFAELPGLEQFRAESDSLLPRFSVVGKTRNNLVHGAIANISIKNGAFMFSKIDVSEESGHSIRPVFLDHLEFPALRKELLCLGTAGDSLARKVWDSLKDRT